MKLESSIYFKSSARMSETAEGSVDIVVTSPPYPMIQMWDEVFSAWSPEAGKALTSGDGREAFRQMHLCLDKVWEECCRVLKPGGFACINIGDATRKIGDDFRLYPNHSIIQQKFLSLGFDSLPAVLWRKPTNAPNKFMGSGMLPAGAYVTLEHEYILIFRKGSKRSFSASEKLPRRQSAFFWEERNIWFSDVWDFKGTGQKIKKNGADKLRGDTDMAGLRNRSGAFPLELPHRLVNMYSMLGDTVLDPFVGTGTTLSACILNGRRCIGYELDHGFKDNITEDVKIAAETQQDFVGQRLERHKEFVVDFTERKGIPKYMNRYYNFPVVTAQEQDLSLPLLESLEIGKSSSDELFFRIGYRR